MKNIYTLKGRNPGPTSVIMAGVHGDEPCGVEAFKKLLPNLTILRGKVYFIYGNPKAIKRGIRKTEADLNRMFKPDSQLTNEQINSYEYRRAQKLKKYLNQADALLDIHSSGSPVSQPFVICEKNSIQIAKYLPTNLVTFGFDKIEPGGTDYYMNKIGKSGICIECGLDTGLSAINTATEAVFAFLKIQNHIDGKPQKKSQKIIQMYKLYYTKTNSFKLVKPFADFQKIKEGEPIGKDGSKTIVSSKDSFILFARNRNQVGDEAFLLGRKIK